MGFAGKEYNINNFETSKSIDSIKKDVKIIDDPIIEVINEDEILFLTKLDKNVFLGLTFDTNGNIAPKNNLSINARIVKQIHATTKYLLCIVNDFEILVYHKHDMLYLQKIVIPEVTKYLHFSNSMQEIFCATSEKGYHLEVQNYENQIKECLKKCKGKEALSIFEAYYSKFSKVDKKDSMYKELNYRIGYITCLTQARVPRQREVHGS